MKNFIFRWGPMILMMTLIFWASSTPSTELPNVGKWDLFLKKGGHMYGYAMLAIAMQHGFQRKNLVGSCLVWGLVTLYAISDEFHQIFTVGRKATAIDVGIDMVGALIGLAVVLAWNYFKQKSNSLQKMN